MIANITHLKENYLEQTNRMGHLENFERFTIRKIRLEIKISLEEGLINTYKDYKKELEKIT